MAHDSNLETKAGIWLLLATGIACTIIIFLAEMPVWFKSTYRLTVEFPDASGLAKGADVDLSGALIGKVATDPRAIPDSGKVAVDLEINRSAVLRRNAEFIIGTPGVFGDKFVEVHPQEFIPGVNESPLLRDCDTVVGAVPVDMKSLMAAALPLIQTANDAAGQLDDMVTKLNKEVLTPDTCNDLKATVAQVPDLMANGKTLFNNARGLVAQVKSENGVVGQVFYNPQMKDELAQFMTNFKKHGLVFYQDDSAPQEAWPGPKPAWRGRQ